MQLEVAPSSGSTNVNIKWSPDVQGKYTQLNTNNLFDPEAPEPTPGHYQISES